MLLCLYLGRSIAGKFNPLAPFAGFRHSRHGRAPGKSGIEEFLEIKSLQP
jgi:aldehyde dehydrogenase (NAD+)